MSKRLDLTGQQFGRLTVKEFSHVYKLRTHWKCECECGNFKTTDGVSLRRGVIKSCGCLQKENRSVVRVKNIPNKLNLIGQQFARLTVKEFSHTLKGLTYWKCECECGNLTTVVGAHLNNGHTKSCGCLALESAAKLGRSKKTHGLSQSYYFTTLSTIKLKCLNPTYKSYWSHGAKGITVCARWLESLDNFVEDVGERPTENHCLLLKVGAKEFNKENCYWGTIKQKGRQDPRNRPLTYQGVTKPMAQWAEELGLDYGLISQRARLIPPWSDEDILTKSVERGEHRRLRATVKQITKDL